MTEVQRCEVGDCKFPDGGGILYGSGKVDDQQHWRCTDHMIEPGYVCPVCICAVRLDVLALETAQSIDGGITGLSLKGAWTCVEHGAMKATVQAHLTFPREKKSKVSDYLMNGVAS